MKFFSFRILAVVSFFSLAGISSFASPAHTQSIRLSPGSEATVYAFENTQVTCETTRETAPRSLPCRTKLVSGYTMRYEILIGEDSQGEVWGLDDAIAKVGTLKKAGLCS